MGWFSREENKEPSRQNRHKCWEARDSYFGCLDRANVVKAGDEGNICAKEKQCYENNCVKSWVRLHRNYRLHSLKSVLDRSNISTNDGS